MVKVLEASAFIKYESRADTWVLLGMVFRNVLSVWANMIFGESTLYI